MSTDRNRYRAPALEKGLDVLELLSSDPRPHMSAEIAEALGRSRSEIFRMLSVLEGREYIGRSGGEGFVLTTRLFELAMRSPPTGRLLDRALPVMERLAESTNQSCHVAVASGDEMVVLAGMESPDEVGFAVRIGHRRSLVDSTSGRVLLAFQTEERQHEMLARIREHRAFDEAALRRDLARIRKRGHRREPSSFVEGIVDLSCPVFDGAAAGAVAALTIPFVKKRNAERSRDEVIEELAAAAAHVSATLRIRTGAAPERERAE